jgi:hypothetical protein
VNCNIGVLSAPRLALVALPAMLGKDFVIKAHSGPTNAARLLQRLGWMRVTYIYRDPRDAMLSAFEYGQRVLARGRPNAFSHLTDFPRALEFMTDYVRIWERWKREPMVLVARYEDLLTAYDTESLRLAEFLHVNPTEPRARLVLEKYRPDAAAGQQGLHFSKGKIGRFREVYTQEQQAELLTRFGPFLTRMGYPA